MYGQPHTRAEGCTSDKIRCRDPRCIRCCEASAVICRDPMCTVPGPGHATGLDYAEETS